MCRGLIGLYRAGKLRLDELIARRYRIEDAPQALADLAAGGAGRGVIMSTLHEFHACLTDQNGC